MKRYGLIGTATVLLLLGSSAPASARQEKPKDEAQPQKQEQPSPHKKSQRPAKAQPARQQPRQTQSDQQIKQHQRARPQPKQPPPVQPEAQPERARQPLRQHQPAQAARQPQARPQVEQRVADRPAHQRPRVQQAEQRRVWPQYRARSWQSEHRTWQQRGGYHGNRIPDARFHQYFGQDHGFRIYNLPLVMVRGRPRFEVGGLWFSLVDPWPEYWSNDWYESDDMYVDYSDDGYYLYNRNHPEVRLAVTVFLN
jgi:hypothetical protein